MLVDSMLRGLPVSSRVAYALSCALGVGTAALVAGCGRVGYELASGARAERVSDGGDVTGIVDGGAGGGTAGGGTAGAGAAGSGGSSIDMSGGRGGTGGNGATAGGASQGGTDAAPPDSGHDSGSIGDAGPDGGGGGARCTLAPQALSDWCTGIPSLGAPPVIDGELECGLAIRTVVPQAYNLPDTPDSTVEYAIAWGDAGLYFYVVVHDPAVLPAPLGAPPWEGDSVELYVDSDGVYSAPPAYDSTTRQIIIAAPGAATTARAETYAVPPTGIAWTSTQFASFPTADGYVVEALITAADLGLASWDLIAGNSLGFDLGLNVSGATADAGTQGTRIGQFFLKAEATPTGHPFQGVTAFCNPVLTAR
jgi:hypothetical protein